MNRSIEATFPFEELNRVAVLESWRKEIHRPVYHVHKWWATRLGSVFRTILLAGLLDKSEDVWASYYRLHNFKDRVVLDPFMGSGVTIGEALKLGCRAIGCDINPVAFFQVREAICPVAVERLQEAFSRLRERVVPLIGSFYLSHWQGMTVDWLYTFWVKIIHCADCGESSRLFSNWIFAANAYPGKKPASRCLCPSCGALLTVQYKDTNAVCPNCEKGFNPQIGPARRTTFVCEHCRREHAIAETYRLTKEPPHHAMYALSLLLPDGQKVYKQPSQEDRDLYLAASERLKKSRFRLPDEDIPSGVNTDQARGYNYLRWRQMFNDRQLFGLGILLREIVKEPSEDVRRQFLLLFSGVLEFNNLFCSFKGEGTGAVRHLFNHHILKPERTPLENNLWGTRKSSGSFSTLFERRLLSARAYAARPFEVRVARSKGKDVGRKVEGAAQPIRPRLAECAAEVFQGDANAFLYCGDSSRLPIADQCVDLVVTDPPYFDNVHYSELADFFHVWLRLGLAKSEPAFALPSTRSPHEVQGTCPKEFGELLGGVFVECVRVLKPDGLLVFTFHHSRNEAWLAVLSALRKAALRVVATHPIKAEMSVATPKSQAKEPINLDCILVCRSTRQAHAVSAAAFSPKERCAEVVRRFNKSGFALSRGDVRVIVLGAFLQAATAATFADNGERDTHLFSEYLDTVNELHAAQTVVVPRLDPTEPDLFSAIGQVEPE